MERFAQGRRYQQPLGAPLPSFQDKVSPTFALFEPPELPRLLEMKRPPNNESQDRQEFKLDAVFFRNYAESELLLAGFVFPEQ